MPIIVDFFRDPSTGNGISGRTVSLRKHVDGTEIDTTVTDANGMFAFDIDYEGPVYYTVDDGSGTYKRHSGKSVGQIGPIWLDATRRVLAGMGKGTMTGLAVSADGLSMDVSVAAGTAILKDGIPYYSDDAQTVTIGAADGTNPRIDLVVLRVTRAGQSEEGKVALTTVAGTPAATPAAPSPTASSSTDDLVLAEVLVDAGATTIASGKVTDKRAMAGQEILSVPLAVSTLDGVTATATELNTLDGITASTAELNYTDGVTSAIQTQLDGKVSDTGDTITGDVTIKKTSDTAFQVKLDDDTAALVVDTNGVKTLRLQTTGLRVYSDAGSTQVAFINSSTGDLTLTGDVSAVDVAASGTFAVTGAATLNGNVTLGNNSSSDTTTIHSHFQVKAAGAFTVSLGAAAGTGGSAAASRMRGSDQAGEFQVVTGSSGVSTGTLASISFAYSRPSSDYVVFLQASSINAADLNLNVTNRSSTGFDIRANAAPGTGETLQIAFWLVEVDA